MSLSYLFPNKFYPSYGIFVLNRLKHVNRYCEIKVIAPVPYFPFMEILSRYHNYSKVPRFELLEGLDVFHPKFLIVPKYCKWLDAITYFLSTLPRVLKLRKTFDFDLVDVHWVYPDILAGYIYSRITRKKLVVTVRGKEAILFGNVDIRNRIVDFFMKKADLVVALSEELAELLQAKGVDKDRIVVIRNGVDTEQFRLHDKRQSRDNLGIDPEKNVILSVGSLIERKGFDKVICCLPAILKKHPNIVYYIVGSAGPEGNFETQLRQLIQKKGLEKHVIMAGNQPNERLVSWYNAADLFCLPSKGEGSPNVVYEALACGTPVVAHAVGDVPEALCQPFLGYLVDPDDPNDLERKLLAGLHKPWDRQQISTYMGSFTWDSCARQVMQHFEGIVGRSFEPLPRSTMVTYPSAN